MKRASTDSKNLINRLSLFDDTTELRDWLIERAERDGASSEDNYYLKEVEASLHGLHDLVHQMAQHIHAQEGSE